MYNLHAIASSSILLQGNLLDSMVQIEYFMYLHSAIENLLSKPVYRASNPDFVCITKDQVGWEDWNTFYSISYFIFNDLLCDGEGIAYPSYLWH